MEKQLAAELMLLCGALNDISEKSKDFNVRVNVKEVENKIEGLLEKYFVS